MAGKIEFHAALEARFAQQGVIHAHHFRAFFIHGGGVKIIHFYIAGGAHGVCHRAGIFGKLELAQGLHVFYAAHGAAGSIARKFLVAEHG